ncbi:steryl-sulfatase-like isoform X2 [Corticium candelabrum]|uniref:steryl-sulfatase-like isoform X2 n=1 Tax=Corticium candelabrum TaxID=121492 RepID=UPI002E25F737|nr:steryl-sulfatase-like isoform X2 [Corticium candelabrum]
MRESWQLWYSGTPRRVTVAPIRLQLYSAFHVCSPSRAAMLTGRLPIRSGCAGSGPDGGVFPNNAVGGLPTNETTIPELLKSKEYKSAAVGKWHLGQRKEHLPTNNGFDEYFGVPYSDDMGASAWTSEKGIPLPLVKDETVMEQPANLGTLTQRYADYCRDFIERNKNNNFFLYMAFNHVHTPNFVSKEFCNTSIRGRYGDAAAEMDDAIGQIMKSLKDNEVDNNTIVFFTSDNGPWLIRELEGGSAGLLYEGKTTTWEGGVREPGIVRFPPLIKAGRISHEVVTTYDIFSTVLTLADVREPTDRIIDGRDMSPILFDVTGKTSHKCLFIYKGTPNEKLTGLWAIRCGPYKAHYVTNTHLNHTAVIHNPALLYHLEYDPGENFPIDSKSSEYEEAMLVIEAAKKEHEATLKPVPNQMAMGGNDEYKLCCDKDSQKKYSQYPPCTCNPENFHAWKCGNPV